MNNFSPNMLKTFDECQMKFYLRYVRKLSIPQKVSIFEKGKKVHALANYYLNGEDVSKMEISLNQSEKEAWEKLKNSQYLKLNAVNTEYNLSCKVGKYWVGGRLDALMSDSAPHPVPPPREGRAPEEDVHQKISHLYSKIALQKAQELRKNMTDAEQILWYFLQKKQMNGLKFRKQSPIGDFIVDFVCFENKMVIELDGGEHLSKEQLVHDSKRDKFLREAGFNVIRIFNNDVYEDIEKVLEYIYRNSLEVETDVVGQPAPPEGEGLGEGQSYTILDYKTGSIPKNPEYDYQTMVYLLAADKFLTAHGGFKSLRFVYINLKTNEDYEIMYSKEKQKEYSEKIINICQNIDFAIDSTAFAKKKDCGTCEFKNICYKF